MAGLRWKSKGSFVAARRYWSQVKEVRRRRKHSSAVSSAVVRVTEHASRWYIEFFVAEIGRVCHTINRHPSYLQVCADALL